AKRAPPRRIARHAHVLCVGDAPAMQRGLLHGGDDEFAVGTDGDAEMRALPFEILRGRTGRIGKPERGAVVVRDGETKAFRRESKPRHRRWRFERAQRALFSANEGGLARRPGDGAIGPERHLIDPAPLVVGGDNLVLAVGIGGDQLAVVAAGNDAGAVGYAGEDATLMHEDAMLAMLGREQQGLLAQHEHRRIPEKMHADDGAAGSDLADAVGEGGGGGSDVGHDWISSYPLPAELGFTRVLQLLDWPKSDISDFGCERVPSERSERGG